LSRGSSIPCKACTVQTSPGFYLIIIQINKEPEHTANDGMESTISPGPYTAPHPADDLHGDEGKKVTDDPVNSPY
jgi:hypothetical protein